MVDDVYKLIITLDVMKEQRKKLISDFTDQPDYIMMKGLYHYQCPAEFRIYAELYHILWVDEHWNQLTKTIERDVELSQDRFELRLYFAQCFLKYVEGESSLQNALSPFYFELLRIKASTLREMIYIANKFEDSCAELEYARELHRQQYLKKLNEYSNCE